MLARGATATCVFTFPESVDFGGIEAMNLYVVGEQSGTRITKSLATGSVVFMEDNRIRVDFSQTDTLMFADNEGLRMHWHWRNQDGTAKKSKIILTHTDEFFGEGPI